MDTVSQEHRAASPPAYEPNSAPLISAATDDEPPSYREDRGADPDELLPACTLALHGRFIYHAAAAPGTTDSEPLYQLSRVIHVQGRATESIAFQRLDYVVRSAPDGSPAVSRRAKDVYELHHHPPMLYAGIPAQLLLLPRSRKTLGEVHIEKSPLFHAGYRALRVRSDHEKRRQLAMGRRTKEGEYHFVIRGDADAWEWRDPDGKPVARQTCEHPAEDVGGDTTGEYKLTILVPLTRRTLDGLVAMWCVWLWHLHIARNTQRKTWEDRQYSSFPMFPVHAMLHY